MKSYYFTYPKNHKNYGGYIKVIAQDWRSAKEKYDLEFNIDDSIPPGKTRNGKIGRDYHNFYEFELFKNKFSTHIRGELKLII